MHPTVAKERARHSTITLTIDRYTHIGLHDQFAALESLPGFSHPRREHMKATGTDGEQGTDGYSPHGDASPRLAFCLADSDARRNPSVPLGANFSNPRDESYECTNTRKDADLAINQADGEGFEPPVDFRPRRFSRPVP